MAAARGLAVLLCPAYLGAGGGDEGFYREMLERARGFDRKNWPNFADPRFPEENDLFFIRVDILEEKP